MSTSSTLRPIMLLMVTATVITVQIKGSTSTTTLSQTPLKSHKEPPYTPAATAGDGNEPLAVLTKRCNYLLGLPPNTVIGHYNTHKPCTIICEGHMTSKTTAIISMFANDSFYDIETCKNGQICVDFWCEEPPDETLRPILETECRKVLGLKPEANPEVDVGLLPKNPCLYACAERQVTPEIYQKGARIPPKKRCNDYPVPDGTICSASSKRKNGQCIKGKCVVPK